jgi:hypothetical protein
MFSSWIAVRRTTVHLLARLVVTATCTSSAAALDATHISRMTVVIASRIHSLEFPPRKARPNQGRSSSAAVEASSFLMGGRRSSIGFINRKGDSR